MSDNKISPRRIIAMHPDFLLAMMAGENHYRTDLPAETKAVAVHYDWKRGVVLLIVEGPGILEASLGEPLVSDFRLPALVVTLTRLAPTPIAEAQS